MSSDGNSGGYGKPPKKNRFKPGQSGNPNGRPMGLRNMRTILDEELKQTVSITENGKRIRVPKGRLAIRQLVNKAAQGDVKALSNLLKMLDAAAYNSTPQSGMPMPGRSELTHDQCWEFVRQLSVETKDNEP